MKAMFNNTAVHATVKKMREKGHNVRTWSQARGFRAQTVRNLLAGQYKHRQSETCRKIRAALVEDGFVEVSL